MNVSVVIPDNESQSNEALARHIRTMKRIVWLLLFLNVINLNYVTSSRT